MSRKQICASFMYQEELTYTASKNKLERLVLRKILEKEKFWLQRNK